MKYPFTILLFVFTLALHAQSDSAQGTIKVVAPHDDDDVVFQVVEEGPSFKGGENAEVNFLRKNTIYPDSCKKAKQQGIVIIVFIVEKDGSLSDIKPIREVPGAPLLTAEAIRVVQMMPRWVPAKVQGKPVRCTASVPVQFRLN